MLCDVLKSNICVSFGCIGSLDMIEFMLLGMSLFFFNALSSRNNRFVAMSGFLGGGLS